MGNIKGRANSYAQLILNREGCLKSANLPQFLENMLIEQKTIDDKECETMVGAAAKEAQQVFIERGKEWLKHNIVKYAGMFKEHYEDELGRETIKVCPCVDAALYDDFEKAMKK